MPFDLSHAFRKRVIWPTKLLFGRPNPFLEGMAQVHWHGSHIQERARSARTELPATRRVLKTVGKAPQGGRPQEELRTEVGTDP